MRGRKLISYPAAGGVSSFEIFPKGVTVTYCKGIIKKPGQISQVFNKGSDRWQMG